jgi:hypothetical protein
MIEKVLWRSDELIEESSTLCDFKVRSQNGKVAFRLNHQ